MDTVKPSDGPSDGAADRSPSPVASSFMRRNESAAAGLGGGGAPPSSLPVNSAVRKNKSFSALSELSRRERSQPASSANRQTVIEAVVLELLQHIARALADSPAESDEERRNQQLGAMKTYIETIVTQLDLPNSCIIAMLVYIERAVANERFALTDQNWQPSLLAAFVVAAKLSFDEPVWNEDFAKALRISNVPVSQISRWEASFLTLIQFNTNVELTEYANLVFRLQQRYQLERGGRAQFFTYLMLQAQKLDEKSQAV